MRKIRIPIMDLSHTEKTYLDADYSSGTTLTVVNNYGFDSDNIAILGEPGEEKTESQSIDSQSGNTTITLNSALKFDHNKGTVIYRAEYDQAEIYRYRSSAWTLISTSNIQWDKRETIYIDEDGLSTDSYRYRLKNSSSGNNSDYSPTVAGTGFTRNQVGYMIDQIRKIGGDEDRKLVTDSELIKQLNKAQEIIGALREDWWFLRKEISDITTIANTDTYGLNDYLSDLNFIDTVRYRYNDGTTDNIFHLKSKTMLEIDYLTRDNDADTDDWPRYYTQLPADDSDETGYIRIDKKSKTTGYGTFYIRYFQKMTDLDDVADETLVPIPSILEDYGISYLCTIGGNDTKADLYMQKFMGPQNKERGYSEPTGVELLKLMQKSKEKSVGQPESLKKWRGRKPMSRFFGDNAISPDDIRERYF
jgi:hypothetical protein